MTNREERERVLQGLDTMANAIIGYLLARDWSSDRILKNVAEKMYSPHRALVRVEYDSENQQYWVKGEYVSKGENVLSGCFACLEATLSPAEIAAAMGEFLQEAESRISQSFAVRFVGETCTDGSSNQSLEMERGAMPTREEALLWNIPNPDEIVAAGLPREQLLNLGLALETFWRCYNAEFPEVTSGDSQMVDDPSNAMAVWISQCIGIELDRCELVLPVGCTSNVGCSNERVEAALESCMTAVIDALKPAIPAIAAPGSEVRGFLKAVLSDVLYWNFPREEKDEDDSDDGAPAAQSPVN